MKEEDDREEEEGPEIISYRGAVFDADAALCRVRVNPSAVAGRKGERLRPL